MKTILLHKVQARERLYQNMFVRSLLIALLALCCSFNAKADSTLVKLSVIDTETNETLPFATVAVFQNGVQIATATTDLDGRCEFKNLAPGQYDFRAVYIGYQAQEVKKVPLFAQKTNWLNIKLKTGYRLTCCCTCYCFEDRSENWWPKLWTPYREMYKEWKEKKERRLAKQNKKKEISTAAEPTETIDSTLIARVAQSTSVEESIKIYPNPSSGIVHIESNGTLQKINVMNEEGKIMIEETMNSGTAELNLRGFANGVYYLNYSVNGKAAVEKVVVISD